MVTGGLYYLWNRVLLYIMLNTISLLFHKMNILAITNRYKYFDEQLLLGKHRPTTRQQVRG